MRAFYAESGFALDEERARAAFEALLADARLGRVWLIGREASKAGPAVGYIVVTFVFAMEYGGMAATVDDFFVRPEARGEGLGKAALAEVRRACEGLGMRALRVEVGVDNPSLGPRTGARASSPCPTAASWRRRSRRRPTGSSGRGRRRAVAARGRPAQSGAEGRQRATVEYGRGAGRRPGRPD